MQIVDILIILFSITAVLRGAEIGFVRQFCATVGFFGGLGLGLFLEPHIVRFFHSSLSRSLVTLFITLGFALLFLTIGEYLGIKLKAKLDRQPIKRLDNGLGSVLSVISVLAAAWLSAAILVTLPSIGVQRAVRSSTIIGFMDRHLPSAPNVIADLGYLIDPNGFPQVFTGLEPTPPAHIELPGLDSLRKAVTKDQASIVKIEGEGCGGIVEGSGFVVGSDLVATNAHVVAGIGHVYVIDGNGTHTARAIWFDPDLDFSVLRVPNLAGGPLELERDEVPSDTVAAIAGYPGGGGFTASGARVLDQFTATGRNIYGQGRTDRDVYELAANVHPGNSGGPLILSDGSVGGIVFAESTTYDHVGYALTMTQVIHELHTARAQNQPVSTGSCAE